MANRLRDALDSAAFNYTEEEMQKDIDIIENIDAEEEHSTTEHDDIKSRLLDGGKKTLDNISGFLTRKKLM